MPREEHFFGDLRFNGLAYLSACSVVELTVALDIEHTVHDDFLCTGIHFNILHSVQIGRIIEVRIGESKGIVYYCSFFIIKKR